MFLKSRVKSCSVCSAPVSFEFTILDTLEGQKISSPNKSIYCKTHFLKKIEESLNKFSHHFIFYKPEDFKKYSQMFYYTQKQLLADDYTKQDCQDIENLLFSAKPSSDKSIISIDTQVINCAQDPPLFKIKNPQCQLIDKEEFLRSLSDYLLALSYKFPENGSFWFVLPYSERGIYIYFDYQ